MESELKSETKTLKKRGGNWKSVAAIEEEVYGLCVKEREKLGTERVKSKLKKVS